jgi:hypothetical protein
MNTLRGDSEEETHGENNIAFRGRSNSSSMPANPRVAALQLTPRPLLSQGRHVK